MIAVILGTTVTARIGTDAVDGDDNGGGVW